MRIATSKGIVCTVAMLLVLTAGPAFAITEVIIGPMSAVLPDADGFLDGDSDCYLEVRVDGTLIGVTPVINGSNIPSWPTTTFTYQYSPPSSPFLIVSFKAYDVDGLTAQYLGEGLTGYNWASGSPTTYTTTLSEEFGPGYTVTSGYDANEVAVPVEGGSWGSIKALYR
jgi:hypothetical protein